VTVSTEAKQEGTALKGQKHDARVVRNRSKAKK